MVGERHSRTAGLVTPEMLMRTTRKASRNPPSCDKVTLSSKFLSQGVQADFGFEKNIKFDKLNTGRKSQLPPNQH